MIVERNQKREESIKTTPKIKPTSFKYPDVPCPQNVAWIEQNWGEFT